MPGNSSLPLVSVRGTDNDAMRGPMLGTNRLGRCPYIRQILAAFGTVIGRTRLMRLDAGAEVSPHYDAHYYWHDRVRVHIPVVSDPGVRFRCDGHEAHMAPGEAWILDNRRLHSVVNASAVQRIHLVFDTVGSAAFWDMVDPAAQPPARLIAFDPACDAQFPVERCNLPEVMPPAELAARIAAALDDARPGDGKPIQAEALLRLEQSTTRCLRDWRATWAAHGDNPDGRPAFRALQERLLAGLAELPEDLRLRSNGRRLVRVLMPLYRAALAPGAAGELTDASAAPPQP